MDDARDLVAGAHRHRRFGDDHGETGDRGGDLARGGIDVGKIRSACPSPRREGVPTAMKTAAAEPTDFARSVVNARRPWRTLLAMRSSRPGSKIGISPRSSAAIFAASLSTHTTSWPKSARQAPDTSPT